MTDVQEPSYQDSTVAELQDELRTRGLHVTGTKDELVARLEEDDAARASGEAPAEEAPAEEAAETPEEEVVEAGGHYSEVTDPLQNQLRTAEGKDIHGDEIPPQGEGVVEEAEAVVEEDV